MADGYEPTERERFWLGHEQALADSGLTAKGYAAEHELSLQALYQARKRLRAVGLLGPSAVQRKSPKRIERAFSKVEVMAAQRTPLQFRLSFPNGYVLEWSGDEEHAEDHVGDGPEGVEDAQQVGKDANVLILEHVVVAAVFARRIHVVGCDRAVDDPRA